MNSAVLQASALRELASMRTDDSDIIFRRTRLLQVLNGSVDPFARRNLEHITVSAIVYNADTDALLMIYHAKLQRWLFPGGHVETLEDQTLMAAARRECIEETDLDPMAAARVEPLLVDIDIHSIPANSREVMHTHLDVRYLFRVAAISPLSQGAAWVARTEAIAQFPESIARPAQRVHRFQDSPLTDEDP